MCGMFTQGAALGYVVLPLRGVPLASFAPIVFDLYKILTLTNVNKFPFASLNRIFALTLN